MARPLVRLGSVCTLVVAVAIIYHETRPRPLPVPRSTLPERSAARLAVDESLAGWRDSLETQTAGSKSKQVVFVDQQRRPGQRLRAFAILGDFELESCQCFKVRLDMTEPDESILAVYYVFGQNPMWVYRSEDFERIMHWEMDMPTASESAAEPKTEVKSKSDHPEQAPGTSPIERDARARG